MSIGNPPTSDSINAEITAVAGQLRDAALAAGQLAQKINKLGTAGLTGLSPPFDAADAAAALAFAGQAENLYQVFYGTGSASNFDFDDAFAPVYP
jgi:hypothetical protein